MVDPRQLKTRNLLSQLTRKASDGSALTGIQVDDILKAIDNELTPPLRMRLTASHVVTMDGLIVENPIVDNEGVAATEGAGNDTKRTIPPIDGTSLPLSFTGETLTFPTANGGNITSVSGAPFVLNIGTDLHYLRIGVNMNALGQIVFTSGTSAATEAAATVPAAPSGSFAAGHILIQRDDSGGAGNEIKALEAGNIFQYSGGGGAGGGGTGDANTIDTALRDMLLVSNWDLVTPVIFSADEDSLVDNTSTGEYSLTEKTYNIDAAEFMLTSNMLDENEFLGTNENVSQAQLVVFWEDNAVDTAATYELSRDGGVGFTPITMTRVGSTSVYEGELTEFTDGAVASIASTSLTEDQPSPLNDGLYQAVAQKFTTAAGSHLILSEVDLNFLKTGTPSGNVYISIYSDDGSDRPDTELFKTRISIADITAGTQTYSISEAYLEPSTIYHLVVSTDSTYKASYVAATTEIGLQTNLGGADGSFFNGTVWGANTVAFNYDIRGRSLDLRLKVTSSAADKKLEGFGIFYRPQFGVLSGLNDRDEAIFQTSENLNQFTVNFKPSPDKLRVWDVNTGQVYVYPSFTISDQTITFPADSFDGGGQDYEVHLIFENSEGGTADNSDSNSSRIATHDNQIDALGEKTENFDMVEVAEISVPHTTIIGRAPIKDLSKIPAPKMGIERIDLRELEYLDDETDSSGKTITRPKTDPLDRIRFAGNWEPNFSNFSGQTILSGNGNSDSYIEVTFYGTGLRFLTPTNAAFNYQVSVDGGADTTITESTVAGSTVINNRGYEPNNGVTAVSGLTLGLHTVRISKSTTFDCRVHGFEILNESTQLEIPAGNIIRKDERLSIPATTTDYNTGFDTSSDALGTKGGHVVVYGEKAADGSVSVKKRFKAVDTTAQYLSSADHSNEKLVRKINWREFGVGRADDFSTVDGFVTNATFTLDDGTTTLVGDGVRNNLTYDGTDLAGGIDSYLTLTFVGTGLDVVVASGSGLTADAHDIIVDGSSIGQIGTGIDSPDKRTVSLVSGLPYGTHTVKINRDVFAVSGMIFYDFLIYGPAKPSIPEDAVELGSYNLMADFALETTTTDIKDRQSVGVLSKFCTREFVYTGTQSLNFTTAIRGGFQSNTGGSTGDCSYTFFGNGVDVRFNNDGGDSITIEIDGSTNLSGFTTATTDGGSAVLTPSTGLVSGASDSGAIVSISGLSLGLHTIKLSRTTGTLRAVAFDIHTPIHVYDADKNLLSNPNERYIGSNSIKSEVPLESFIPKKQHFVGGVDLGPNKVKWQRKELEAAYTTSSSGNLFDFYNLEIGKTYRCKFVFTINYDSGSFPGFIALNGSEEFRHEWYNPDGSSNEDSGMIEYQFTAQSTTFTIAPINITGSGNIRHAVGTGQSTYAVLEELPNHTETDQW